MDLAWILAGFGFFACTGFLLHLFERLREGD